MAQHGFQIKIDDQVFLVEGGEEIGAVRKVTHDEIVVYIEGAGDFTLTAADVHAAHDGKVVLARDHLPPALRAAAQQAHDGETE